MSAEAARAYSDRLYPPTPADVAFEEKLRNAASEGPRFPWMSALSLLYPIGAAVYISARTPAPITMILGYGLANLAYLFLAAGIVVGKFRVFGLNKRTHVLIAAAILFTVGTFFSNI